MGRIAPLIAAGVFLCLVVVSALFAVSLNVSTHEGIVDWSALSALGQWAGSAAQTVIAVIAAFIAVHAYRSSEESAKVQYVKELNDSFNEWTKFVCDDEVRSKFMESIESPVFETFSKDAVVYFYLNLMNNVMVAEQNGAISRLSASAMYSDFDRFSKGVGQEKIVEILGRGYSAEFRDFIFRRS